MKPFNYKNVIFVPVALFSAVTFAQQPTSEDTERLIDNAQRPAFSQGALPAASQQDVTPPTQPVTPQLQSQSQHHMLPFWGDEARARGYDLPETFGIGINHMNMRQNIEVSSIAFSGLGWDTFQMPGDLFNIKAENSREKSKTETMRLDAWVLPFLNVYGIVGHTRGSSHSIVSVDADPSQYTNLMDRIIASAVHQMNKSGQLKDLDFNLDFKGTTYGAGFTLAGGYENWFATLDTNYTRTDFNILDGQISALTVTPRVGYRFQMPGISGTSHLNLWVGSMYQDVQQEFKGSLGDLNMPAALQPLIAIAIANQRGEGRFRVKQHLQSPWNVLVGAQYEITRNFNVMTEIGFSERNSAMVSAEYRF
ncbi:porin family protein [Serratia rubidaea]|nr:porin family protein [Serratia rubidaea]